MSIPAARLSRRVDTGFHIGANRSSNPLFFYFFNGIRLVIDTLVAFVVHGVRGVAVRDPAGSAEGALYDRVDRIVTPFLDLVPTMPTFVCPAPLLLFLLIRSASAVIATVIYAARAGTPSGPCPRSRSRRPTPSAWTWLQSLPKLLLQMSGRTAVMGVNQPIMAARAMVTDRFPGCSAACSPGRFPTSWTP